SRAPAPAPGRDRPRVHRRPDEARLRRVRHRQARPGVTSLLDCRRQARGPVDPVPLRLAFGARSHGPARRHDAARALERLEPRAVRRREHEARLGLGACAYLEFSATASRMRFFSASSSISSSSLMSMARRTLPSRLELKRPEGSFKAAPLKNVSLTTFL